MRDSKRIDKILNQLKEIWEKNPDLRLGQLIANCIDQNYVYFIEDDALISRLDKFYK